MYSERERERARERVRARARERETRNVWESGLKPLRQSAYEHTHMQTHTESQTHTRTHHIHQHTHTHYLGHISFCFYISPSLSSLCHISIRPLFPQPLLKPCSASLPLSLSLSLPLSLSPSLTLSIMLSCFLYCLLTFQMVIFWIYIQFIGRVF